MDPKIIFAGISSVLGIACFIPYITDILHGQTKPHSYTWLIWAILQTIAAAGMLQQGARYAIASSVLGAALCIGIFFLSIPYGSKDITTFDKACLAGALSAAVAYMFLRSPLLSIVLVTLTDAAGFAPTFRKAFRQPYTETPSTHLLSSISGVFAILAIANFNLTTSLYLIAVTTMDAACGVVVLIRRKHFYKPK